MRSLIMIIIAVLLTSLVWHYASTPLKGSAALQKPSVYERVTQSKTLRCGYITWPPLSEKEIGSGKMKGLYIDLTEEIARGFGWRVEWIEEVSFTDFVTALQNDRIDMMCAPMTPTAERIPAVYFSRSHFYAPYRAYVRTGDTRFDDNLAAINMPDIRLSVLEGELSSTVARTNFPHAKMVELTALQGTTQLFENVVAGKADIIFQDPFTFATYDQSNPGKLQQVKGGDIGVFSANYAMKMDDTRFKWLIDSAIEDLLNRGYLDKLARDYHLLELGIYMPSKPYDTGKN